MSDHPHVTYKRHTFLSSLVTGVSAFGIVLVISCTVVVIYGMHFVGDRSDKFVSTVGSAIGGLDELQAALPPIIADDHLRPIESLYMSAKGFKILGGRTLSGQIISHATNQTAKVIIQAA